MATRSMFLPGESQGRGAWWAAVYGVAQGQTRLKRLSSCSSSSSSRIGVNSFLNVRQNSPVKPSGPELLFVGSLLITVSISVCVICLFIYSISSRFLEDSCFLRICPFLLGYQSYLAYSFFFFVSNFIGMSSFPFTNYGFCLLFLQLLFV